MGFSSTKSDVSLFFKHTNEVTVFPLMYVDDIIVTGTSKGAFAKLVQHLHSKFSLWDMGELRYFLSIEVAQKSCGVLLLSQTKYIDDLLKKAQMGDSEAATTPMTSNMKLNSTNGVPFEHVSMYRFVVDSLQYLIVTRPEIVFYIEDRKFTAGYCVMFGLNLVSWCSKKQTVVSRFNTEAEYRGIASAVLMSANSVLHSRSKHFEIDLHLVRDHVAKGRVQIHYIHGVLKLPMS
ncbi:uncharacterized protein LOC107626580 [Arachis ipaensis]|uniref:uncharacterized protein LOC107626580 n=1 Tax=Arachis ipaensis TaxID=130454 RepID=UPI0007AF96E7|nr:uncharacterized protein LOC107626580 [Arachis ipaensis]XP_025635459.1 uncharacterized protein LOC112729499 [Arachis hypogaea]